MKTSGLWALKALSLLCPGIVLLLAVVPVSGADLAFSSDIPVTLGTESFADSDTIRHDASGFSRHLSGSALGIAPGINLDAVGVSGHDFLFAVDAPTTLGGVAYSERDLILYDGSSFAKLLDGDAIGIPAGACINASTVLADGKIVFALDIPATLQGTVFNPNDLIQVDGTTFGLYVSGAQLGIPENAGIDAVSVKTTGDLLFSLDIPANLNGLDVSEKDVIAWSGGSTTKYFDGAGAGMPSGSDLNALYANYDPALVLLFPFENDNPITTDVAWNGNDGTVNGPMFVEGAGVRGSNAYRFDWSVADNIQVGYRESQTATEALTLEAWIYPTAWDNIYAGQNRVISKQPVYLLRGLDNGLAHFQILTDNHGYQGVADSQRLALDAWHYVVGTFDGLFLKLYVDGELRGSLELPAYDSIATNEADIYVGESPVLNEGFTGTIDNAAIYKRARSQSEIWETWEAYEPDTDGDGIPDRLDPDDDNDGIADWADPDPHDPNVGLAPAWPADIAAQTNHNWTLVDAASGYIDAVVIAGPPTYHGGDPGVVRLRDVTDLGFELRFQEWDYRRRDFGDTYHAVEDIHYLVLQPGRHTLSDGSVWEVGTFDLGGTGAWEGVLFTEPFVNLPHLFLTVQTNNGSQAVAVRARGLSGDGFELALFEEEALMDGHLTETVGYLAIDSFTGGGLVDLDGAQVPYLLQSLSVDERWSPALSQRLKVEEEKSRDSEVGHTDETLHLLALGDQLLAQQVSHKGGDTTALRRLEPTEDAPMEWGLLRGIDHSWQTLPFAKTYTDPVLVAKPTSNKGGDPGIVRLRNVGADHAQLRYQEWNYLDGHHGAPEDVFYLVSEAGEYSLGGLTVEADWLLSNKLGRAGQWEDISFNAAFVTDPVVLASIMTYNGVDTVTTRIANLDHSGLDLAMDEQESKADGHVDETLGWIAIAQGSGTTAEGRKLQVFFEALNHALTPVVYPSATGHRHPTVVGDVGSTYESDPVFLRYASPTNAQIEFKLTEETSADPEVDHADEDVGVFVGE